MDKRRLKEYVGKLDNGTMDRVEIGKGYDITVKININYEQFL